MAVRCGSSGAPPGSSTANSSPPVRAMGLIAQFGEIHQTFEYPEVPIGRIALEIATRELLARIKAVLRRSAGPKPAPQDPASRFISFDGWRLDTGKRELISADDIVVQLSSAEYELLVAFLTWPQVVLSREKLLDATHGRSAIISDRSIDIQVSRLRRKLGDDPREPRIIKTIWGDGYLFTPDIN